MLHETGERQEQTTSNLTMEELHRCNDSTPGPDGVAYFVIGLL